MFGNLGLPEIIILVVVCLLVIWPLWRICSKAGYSGWLSISLLVPFLNYAVVLYLAFAEWPIERELKQFKASNSRG
jgi:hypothetical protein